MTAEVAVMNSTGVALAADSAVTIGQEATKIYTSAEKLFQLSNSAPVGIMIYGNASFVGIPWETTIKAYRKLLGNKTYPRLEDYAKNFISFLSKSRQIFPIKRQDSEIMGLVVRLYSYLRNEMAEEINTAAEDRDGLEEDDLAEILAEVVSSNLNEVKGRKYLPDFSNKDLPIIRKRLTKMIGEMKTHIFGNLPFTVATTRKLTTIVIEVLARDFFGPTKSGVVISGFGEKEYLPILIHYEMEEMVLNRPRYVERKREIILSENNAAVMAFAQQDMVYSFMQGITSELQRFMSISTAELFVGISTILVNEIKKKDKVLGRSIENIMDNKVPDLVEELFEKWENRQQRYWGPVIQIVSTLPKDELAAMAENLVNLTKFRRRVTAVHETVGGPIDIAIITKGDGFIWIKRKHYFASEYNPRVMARLEKESS